MKEIVLQCRATREERQQLEAEAKARGITVSALMHEKIFIKRIVIQETSQAVIQHPEAAITRKAIIPRVMPSKKAVQQVKCYLKGVKDK